MTEITMLGCMHGEFPQLDGGDLLIITGDCTTNDSIQAWDKFFDWLALQEYKKKIYIAGNHDNLICTGKYKTPKYCDATYLCDSGTEFNYWEDRKDGSKYIKTVKIWGSPHTLWFNGINHRAKAFTGSENDLEKKFNLIPDDIDILITHGPPNGILDKTIRNEHVGAISLRNMVLSKERFPNLKLHCFSHIHEQGGKMIDIVDLKIVNCSIMDEHYQAVNKPVRIQL